MCTTWTCACMCTAVVHCTVLGVELGHSLDMASQVYGKGSCCEWQSYIRGYHEYKEMWSPTLREILRLQFEPTNPQHSFAVAVVKDGLVVGHVPRLVSRAVSFFLKKAGNAGFCEVTGGRINCGVDLGLEVLCQYKFYGADIKRTFKG